MRYLLKTYFKGLLCFCLAMLFMNDDLYAEADRYFKEASEVKGSLR